MLSRQMRPSLLSAPTPVVSQRICVSAVAPSIVSVKQDHFLKSSLACLGQCVDVMAIDCPSVAGVMAVSAVPSSIRTLAVFMVPAPSTLTGISDVEANRTASKVSVMLVGPLSAVSLGVVRIPYMFPEELAVFERRM